MNDAGHFEHWIRFSIEYGNYKTKTKRDCKKNMVST